MEKYNPLPHVTSIKSIPEPIPLEIINIILLQVRIKYSKMFRILNTTLNREPMNDTEFGEARHKKVLAATNGLI